MNLWFRLMGLLLKEVVGNRPQQSPLDEVLTTFRTWPTDLDTNLHMNNGRYLTLMDLGRLDFMARTGLLWPTLKKKMLAILGASQMIFLRPLLVGKPFTISTKLVYWDERWFVMRQHFLQDGQVMAKATVRGMFRQKNRTIAPRVVMQLSGEPLPQARELPADVASWLRSLTEQRDLAKAESALLNAKDA